MINFVKKDMFNIANRIKKVNKNYVIFYNKKSACYQVFLLYLGHKTLCYCLKGRLNAFCVKKAYTTSPKYARKIIKNINKSNQLLMEKTQQNLVQKNIEILNSYLEFASAKNCDVTF